MSVHELHSPYDGLPYTPYPTSRGKAFTVLGATPINPPPVITPSGDNPELLVGASIALTAVILVLFLLI